MNCPEFRNRIIELLDGRNFTHEEQHHLEHCPDCAAEFRAAAEALDAVTPRSNPRASDNLRDRILTAAASAGHPRRNRIYRLLGTMAAAAAIFAGVLLLTVRTPAYAARKHFGCAAAVMNDLKTLRIALRIRTTPRENFTYTDPALPPIPCTVTVEYGDTLRWRIEKPGRTALCDGETARMWLRDAGEGWCSQADGYHPEGELGLLLDLQRLLLAEQAFRGSYDRATIHKWLCVFFRRFFAQQFKRSAMPDGPKVGSVALSPRGDWRMPSDASAAAWLNELENL